MLQRLHKINYRMGIITAVVMAILCIYVLMWKKGILEGNQASFYLTLILITGIYWVAERYYFLPLRNQTASDFDRASFHPSNNKQLEAQKKSILDTPWWVDWTAGVFPVLLVIFLLRSFVYDPAKIPSGSMLPLLQVGDYIAINKYEFGVRLPISNKLLIAGRDPQRGEVVVFRYPLNPNHDYIKRVVGLPGDTVSYLNKELRINGQLISTHNAGQFLVPQSIKKLNQQSQQLGQHRFLALIDPETAENYSYVTPADFHRKDLCIYSEQGLTCTVPANHYFVMGDNRDNSEDSRYWGFVPRDNLVGPAIRVLWNSGELTRIGKEIE